MSLDPWVPIALMQGSCKGARLRLRRRVTANPWQCNWSGRSWIGVRLRYKWDSKPIWYARLTHWRTLQGWGWRYWKKPLRSTTNRRWEFVNPTATSLSAAGRAIGNWTTTLTALVCPLRTAVCVALAIFGTTWSLDLRSRFISLRWPCKDGSDLRRYLVSAGGWADPIELFALLICALCNIRQETWKEDLQITYHLIPPAPVCQTLSGHWA